MRSRWFVFIPILIACILVIQECNNKKKDIKIKTSSTTSYATKSKSSIKTQDGEMILAKTKSPGYYKTKGNQVIELWDDGTVADTYRAVGTYNSLIEFKKAVRGVQLDNPLRPINYDKIKGFLLFGPINEDYDEYNQTIYDVYGLIVIVNGGFEYYQNTFGKSKVFTYIQDLKIVNQN